MNPTKFTAEDFNVFKIDGLDARMEALKERIQPKLQSLGDFFSNELSAKTGETLFPHVAKHARRTINPPNDTWVAFAANSRGYKMVPHFQIGLWQSHMFVWFAVIYEAQEKSNFGKTLESNVNDIYNMIPENYVWSVDHTKPEVIQHKQVAVQDLTNMFQRLQTVKKAEILCGIQVSREDVLKLSDDAFLQVIQDAFDKLIPLYKMR
ncbi:DUF1054 domain-containing protein [Peribacillus sp. SCS-155]|uniref:DUF1054 domain-containing protein n=1 Tax=Peribacillus sedimenti TaxID=3115297 RepID=UPI003906CDFF